MGRIRKSTGAGRTTSVIAVVLVAASVRVGLFAEEPVPPVSLFSVPKIELKKATASAEALSVSKESPRSAAQEFSATTTSASIVPEAGIQQFEMLSGAPVLQQFKPAEELGGAIGWIESRVWDPVFAPEVVNFGRVTLTGGVVAAIKRKNPFCLLHPFVFGAGW